MPIVNTCTHFGSSSRVRIPLQRAVSRSLLMFTFCMLLVTPVAESQAATAASIDGTWVGLLDTGEGSLHVVFNFSYDATGNLVGTFESPDQSPARLPIDEISFDGLTLRCEIRQISAVFEGTLQTDGQSIVGTASQAEQSWPLTLSPGVAVRPKRPQEPTPPFPYDVEEVSYDNAPAGLKLAGTLTKPRTRGRHIAVLLITGSGAQNRDEELLGHKPFLVLADALTRRGIAVLRVDDRGVGGSTGSMENATTRDFVGDVLAGVAYLKSRKDIDPYRIGLLGHSEGGEIAPAAAARSKDVAFVIALAGPGVSGAHILPRQMELIMNADGSPMDVTAFSVELEREIINIVLHEPDDAKVTRKVVARWEHKKAETLAWPISPELKAFIADVDAAAMAEGLMTPWMRYFLWYDSAPALRHVRCPVLALNGSLDLQVDPKQNLPVIEAALKAGRNQDFTVKELAGLNHLFQSASTGSPAEYYLIEETFNPAALELIGDWVVAHAARR